MHGFRLEPLVIELASAFKRRGMTAHLEALRAYWRKQRARPAPSPREWDHETVLGWLAMLRIPPFDHVCPALPEGSASRGAAAAGRPG